MQPIRIPGRAAVACLRCLLAAVDPRSLAGLRQCMADLKLKRGFVVTTGEEVRALGRGIEILPWSAVAAGRVGF